ncbi:efflux RND transporter periplasmic adaptor subunit [Flavobacterium cucumis]|uniref:Membrane fusion protein, cobalt-zinc-cadmium efflux system n=1 Tax=Flavobacterium cucumis TaxID=416016 RepID=A0A1M7ZZ55_9FLAO|nr:efflux RND transporter periplasmic adaptor subunit [Flavobacterium cucumis]SHO74136.1 membrane fusion protein, cobalt-zinc-cadmium efflux system [Flavobacterium cucumis]
MIKNSILIALIGLFISCKEEKTEVVTPNNGLITVTKEQFQSSKMEIATLMENEFNVTVSASGKIDVPPQYRAKITPFIGGYVKSSSFLVGDKVAKGQVLVTLENTEYLDIQKEYVAIAEQINYLKSEFERQKTLYNEKITSQKNYLKAESDYRQAKGMYQGLREKLLLLNINPTNVEKGKFTSVITLKAPISGDITVMNANVGMFMSPSDVIMEVVDTQHLLLNLNVFESDILKIKEGQNIEFTIPQASKEVYHSKVKAVGKSIENKDRSISVLGVLQPELKEKLLSGMFVEASIILTTKKGLSVPNDAIIKENDKSFVLLLVKEQNNQFSFRKTLVATGEVSEHHTEIISDENVHQESKILVKGVFDLN